MKRLELTKGLSFSTMKFSCKKGEPFCVDDEVAEELLSTGRFKLLEVIGESPKVDESGKSHANQSLVPEGSQNPHNDNTDDSDGSKNLDNGVELTAELIEKMKKNELIALAEEKGIDIKDCNTNDERIERIKGALGLVNFGSLEFEE